VEPDAAKAELARRIDRNAAAVHCAGGEAGATADARSPKRAGCGSRSSPSPTRLSRRCATITAGEKRCSLPEQRGLFDLALQLLGPRRCRCPPWRAFTFGLVSPVMQTRDLGAGRCCPRGLSRSPDAAHFASRSRPICDLGYGAVVRSSAFRRPQCPVALRLQAARGADAQRLHCWGRGWLGRRQSCLVVNRDLDGRIRSRFQYVSYSCRW
jgi:hypothetical protein